MKLTKPQQHVVDVMKANKGSYLRKSNLYHWSKIWAADGKQMLEISVWRPTINSLYYKGILIPFDNDNTKFKLNENIN